VLIAVCSLSVVSKRSCSSLSVLADTPAQQAGRSLGVSDLPVTESEQIGC
jgi:hypothetical protein